MNAKKVTKEEKIEKDISANNQISDSNGSTNNSENADIEEKDQKLNEALLNLSKEELIDKMKNLEEILELKTKEITNSKDWKEKYMHLQAEFENAQKRWSKDRNNLRIEYTALVLKNFLPLYDSYKKAIQQDPDNMSITQFYNQFINILQSHDGATKMNVKCNDLFDYHYHEALSSIERDDLPNNTILDIIQDGWMIGKDVLRYAKVITSRKPKPPEPEIKTEIKIEKIKEENKETTKTEELESTENEKID